MLFWLVWAVALMVIAVVFVASLRAYVCSRNSRANREHDFITCGSEARIVALEAQFFLAPEQALGEIRELLEDPNLSPVVLIEYSALFSRLLSQLQSG